MLVHEVGSRGRSYLRDSSGFEAPIHCRSLIVLQILCDFGYIVTPGPVRRQYPLHPLVGVGAVIVDKGRVLLVKRARAPLLGQWSIPGGLLELGESLRQAAEREAWEETGLEVKATELLGVFERILIDRKERTRYHYVLVDFLSRRTGGKLAASGDAADARWFRPQQLENLEVPDDTLQVIRLAVDKAARFASGTARSRAQPRSDQLPARQR